MGPSELDGVTAAVADFVPADAEEAPAGDKNAPSWLRKRLYQAVRIGGPRHQVRRHRQDLTAQDLDDLRWAVEAFQP